MRREKPEQSQSKARAKPEQSQSKGSKGTRVSPVNRQETCDPARDKFTLAKRLNS